MSGQIQEGGWYDIEGVSHTTARQYGGVLLVSPIVCVWGGGGGEPKKLSLCT